METSNRGPVWIGTKEDHIHTLQILRSTLEFEKLWLVSWCFKPSQLQRITSGLGETFTMRYIVERTNMAETRPKEQSEKVESCRENLWNKIKLKVP